MIVSGGPTKLFVGGCCKSGFFLGLAGGAAPGKGRQRKRSQADESGIGLNSIEP
jgi:hypothetical protein